MKNKTLKNGGFICIHCRHYVAAEPFLSGSHNRNHCPDCLWSSHVDLFKVGDRLSACRAGMKPVGLTLKKTRKKYRRGVLGELMLIHVCIECGAVSINRIAADDDSQVVLEVFKRSLGLEPGIRAELENEQIIALGAADVQTVSTQLFGREEGALVFAG